MGLLNTCFSHIKVKYQCALSEFQFGAAISHIRHLLILPMQADENLRLELEEDVKEECTKLGPIDSVKVIDIVVVVVVIPPYLLKTSGSCRILCDAKSF